MASFLFFVLVWAVFFLFRVHAPPSLTYHLTVTCTLHVGSEISITTQMDVKLDVCCEVRFLTILTHSDGDYLWIWFAWGLTDM